MTSVQLELTTARVDFWVRVNSPVSWLASRSRARGGRAGQPRPAHNPAGAEHSDAPAVAWPMTYLAASGLAALPLLSDLAVLPITLRNKSYHVETSRSAVSRPDSVIVFATSDVPWTSCGSASSIVTTNRPAASTAAR